MVKQLQVSSKLNVEQLAGNQDIENMSIDYNGHLILLVLIKTGQNDHYEIFHVTEWGIEKIIIPPVQEAFHHAQPLWDNWLLVHARAEGKETHNAFVFDENQKLVSSFHMGDGIEDVQTTKNGEIWASYFDEGVFGDSIGSSGLHCFDKNGKVIFDFARFIQTPSNHEILFIDDCYALNVFSNHTVYLYYYSDFPLLALYNKTNYELVNNDLLKKSPIAGSKAFSIWKDYILFGDGYNKKGQIHLYSLKNRTIQSYKPVNEENNPIDYDYAIGRKDHLFLVCKNLVYHLTIRDILE